MKSEELNNLIRILRSLGINDNDYFKYISQKNRIRVFDIPTSTNIWGCFIIESSGLISGLKFLVPKIKDEKTLLINIHELSHGYELFPFIGSTYQENIEQSENYARSMEEKYLNQKH